MSLIATQDRLLKVSIFFALVLLLALAVPMYLSALNQVKFNDWVTHTHDVQNELQQILAEMTDAETADRGYVISDDQTYLAPYKSAIRNLPSHLRAVQTLTRDNPVQHARFLKLDSTVQHRLAFIATIVQAQRQHQGALAQALIKTGEGQRLHDLARSQVSAMLATEADLLLQRREAARRNINMYLSLVSVDMAISLLLIFFVLYRLWHELRLRRSTESALRLSNADLVASNALRSAILDSAPYSVIAMDTEGVIHTFNKAAERMLWYSADEIIGKTPKEFHDIHEVAAHAKTLSQELGYTVPVGMPTFFAKPNIQCPDDNEWTYIRKNGSRFPVRLVVAAIKEDKKITGYLGIAYDISEEKRAREYIKHIALHDALTGLPNRSLLGDRVHMGIEHHRRNNLQFALGMIDLDHFKRINDEMGHHIGDKLLQQFVLRLKSCIRPTDTLARMGGDEFVLLLPEVDAMEVVAIANRIFSALKTPINVTAKALHINASIGFSFYPEHGQSMTDLLRCADQAMYMVKKQGRNGYKIYEHDMDTKIVHRANMEQELYRALENNSFVLHYQPKIDLATGTMLGVEALLRLPLNNGEFIPPLEFIPLAEELGLIVPIGLWVLETACREIQQLSADLLITPTVAVNISPIQFSDGKLSEHVQAILMTTHLNNTQLELEITESVLMDSSPAVLATLQDMTANGISIALDDFGTGYSSLSYLKHYPINTLKIDQSFVRDSTIEKSDANLIATIIAMGHALGMKVIAEGVENQAQYDLLVALKCDQCQGYYTGRPMSYAALRAWLT